MKQTRREKEVEEKNRNERLERIERNKGVKDYYFDRHIH